MREDRGAIRPNEEAAFLEFAGRCFEHKRKTLLNNLKAALGAETAAAAVCATGLRPDARAEQLSVEEFIALFHAVRED
jgi:16S rRNA (adenine1518-N6/adenine1519-N6)-dimethyltransferase